MDPADRRDWLRTLRQRGYEDAIVGLPSAAKSLPGPEDRSEYLRGYRDGYFELSPIAGDDDHDDSLDGAVRQHGARVPAPATREGSGRFGALAPGPERR